MRLAIFGAVAALLAACGQKGPLYLPDKNAGVTITPAAPPLPAESAPQQPAPVPQPQSAAEMPAPPQSSPAAQAPATPAPQKKDSQDGDSQTPRQ
jgi:predicted small lipoprotein YifL